MALVSGPGRGGGLSTGGAPDELELVIQKHVEYIRKLDTVRVLVSNGCAFLMTLTEER
jgi:geranylgeranyl transferase type-2 subunit beta